MQDQANNERQKKLGLSRSEVQALFVLLLSSRDDPRLRAGLSELLWGYLEAVQRRP
jgi:hypothetical protein